MSSGRLYITAEDDKLHRLHMGTALLFCGRVMVSPASEGDLATRGACEDCELVAERMAEGPR
jgi:hypothetical protein